MAIRFEEHAGGHVDAVRAFNRRVAAALDPELLFPERPEAAWLAKGELPGIFQEAFLALDGDVVRGGYFLKHQPFWIAGEVRRVSCYRQPVSEGIVDRAYASLALRMMRDALARQPLLFSLGMGGLDRPIARLQKAAGWSQHPIPFQFRVLRGGRFLRNIAPARATAVRRALAVAAVYSGTGPLAFAALRRLRGPRVPAGVSIESFGKFDAWADELWERAKGAYSLIAVRDRTIASALYPEADSRFLRWKVTDRERVLGWAVCLDTAMRGHKQFGELRVATIVDGMADPEDAGVVLAAVTRELEGRGADLVISNQMHAAWSEGLRASGFFEGPSNYIFSASKQLSDLIAPFSGRVTKGHMNRGDGDGPIHL